MKLEVHGRFVVLQAIVLAAVAFPNSGFTQDSPGLREAARSQIQRQINNDMTYGTDDYFGDARDLAYADSASPSPKPQVQQAQQVSSSHRSNSSSGSGQTSTTDTGSSEPATETSDSGAQTTEPGAGTETPPPPVEPPPAPPGCEGGS